MKVRIIKHSGPKFEVQRKLHWWSRWQTEGQYVDGEVWIKKFYTNLESARKTVKKLGINTPAKIIEEYKLQK